MDKQKAVEILLEIQRLIPKSFAVYGTCLGAVREGSIIDGDGDIDVGIFFEDWRYEIIDDLKNSGFFLKRIYSDKEIRSGILVKNDIIVELHIFYKSENGAGRFEYLGGKIRHEYPEDIFVPIIAKIDGNQIRCFGEKYLECVYGDWRQRKNKFNYKTDYKCKSKGKIWRIVRQKLSVIGSIKRLIIK